MGKPRVTPYRRHDRPGKWRCSWGHYEGTGYSVCDAYYKCLAAITCRPVHELIRKDKARRARP